MAIRVLLGFFEAGTVTYIPFESMTAWAYVVLYLGFFPGCVYLISCWYVRYEVQTRLVARFMAPPSIRMLINITLQNGRILFDICPRRWLLFHIGIRSHADGGFGWI